ncbi:hypothetical protein LBW59_24290 [Ralstonia solanacearum]|uniref:Transmembrane protein n=1 Tax=Ralstonia solanacearum TaxID=305 RepID=A0AAW5ZW10_RALSL|nr:hypothetical protein [Ralstonia solanacearum]MDB0573867.1 hypothetical protein [Ralstonia solanacearum]
MSKINIHAGDFLEGTGSSFASGKFNLKTKSHPHRDEEIPTSRLESVEIASEQSVKRVWGTLGAGLLGYLALGPFGAFAGLLVGGNKKNVTFIATFKDGRKFLATTDGGTYTKLQAAVFR